MIGAKYRVGANETHQQLDNLGDIIVMNGWSRSGGLLNEWDKGIKNDKFVPQKLDGQLIRQDYRSNGFPESFSTWISHCLSGETFEI